MTKLRLTVCILVTFVLEGIAFCYGAVSPPDKYLHVPLLSFILYPLGGIILLASLSMYKQRRENESLKGVLANIFYYTFAFAGIEAIAIALQENFPVMLIIAVAFALLMLIFRFTIFENKIIKVKTR
jgi:uncharacterized membrane protein